LPGFIFYAKYSRKVHILKKAWLNGPKVATGIFEVEPSLNLLLTFLQPSGNLPGTFREPSRNLPGTFQEPSRNLPGNFREHSGNIPGIFDHLAKC
jgi:hypothetical protein